MVTLDFTYRIYKKFSNPVWGFSKDEPAGFFNFPFSNLNTQGYFEISDSLLRSENNRVLFNMTLKIRASDSLNTRPVIAKANMSCLLDGINE